MSPSKTHTAISSLSLKHFDAVQVPTPTPGEGEVLIKVAYAAMIAFDTYVNDLGYHATFPMTFGFNSSGTIAEVGSGIEDLKVGDRVSHFLQSPSVSVSHPFFLGDCVLVSQF